MSFAVTPCDLAPPRFCPRCGLGPCDLPKCKCGARLDARGRCPALCEPLPLPQPKYDGPAVIGETHVGRMAR